MVGRNQPTDRAGNVFTGGAGSGYIELSVGVDLVTVLFVFAINIAGDEEILELSRHFPVVPRPLAWTLVAASVLLLGWMNLDVLGLQVDIEQTQAFRTVLREIRILDVFQQIVLIFAGVLGVLSVLTEINP